MIRIGHGMDVHRLVEGRKLILCGVEIPHTLGLLWTTPRLTPAAPSPGTYGEITGFVYGEPKRRSDERLTFTLTDIRLDGESVSASSEPVTKADLYALRLSGHADSASRRKTLQKELGLPEHLSANALLQAINLLFTRSEFLAQYKIDHDCQAE